MSSVSTSKVMKKMGITCCPNTCINHLKKAQRLPGRTARNIGIDDFDKKRDIPMAVSYWNKMKI